jgi:hypothetical protein
MVTIATIRRCVMTERHGRLRVRYYPGHDEWTCIVQRVGPDGMPEADVVSATGATKDEARDKAWEQTDDPEVRGTLKPTE